MIGKVGRRMEIYRKQVEGEIGERKRDFWNTYSRWHNTVISEVLRIWNAVSELPPPIVGSERSRWNCVTLSVYPLSIPDPELVPDY